MPRVIARLALLAGLLAACASPAAAVPVADVAARYDDGRLVVGARVMSPPGSEGCAVSVDVRWHRIVPRTTGARQASSGDPNPGSVAGLVDKTDAQGALAADGCARLGDRVLWTEGTARAEFRVALRPGAYRVCVRASQRRADGGVSSHRACGGVRVPAARA